MAGWRSFSVVWTCKAELQRLQMPADGAGPGKKFTRTSQRSPSLGDLLSWLAFQFGKVFKEGLPHPQPLEAASL